VALLAVLQALRARQRVLYLDFEDTARGIVTRLRSMGASDADMAYLAYVGPDEDLTTTAQRDLRQAINDAPPDLIVIDGFNAAMTLLNLELTDNTDATKFSQRLLKPLAATGACVVYVDHVPKNKDNRGKGGIGAQAKRAMTTGCALNVSVLHPFGRGMKGVLSLTVDKDRPGHVRAASVLAKDAGECHLISEQDGSVKAEIHAKPEPLDKDVREAFDEDELRDTVYTWLDNKPFPQTKTQVREGVKRRREDVIRAINQLIGLGLVTESEGKYEAVNVD
jgi:hypothetical protein